MWGLLPAKVVLSTRPAGKIAPRPPEYIVNGTAPVARLFPDYRADDEVWHKATGFFPSMHFVAVRRDVVERHRWLQVLCADSKASPEFLLV